MQELLRATLRPAPFEIACLTILDDEPEIRRILADTLEEAGFRTMGFSRATEFEAALKSNAPDVCLVDLGLPDRDGLTLVHRLALEQGAIVIIISGRAQVQDRVTGLELGADDYIIKPFDPSEVVARIRARLRKDRAQVEPGNLAKFADWTADFDRYSLIDSQGDRLAGRTKRPRRNDNAPHEDPDPRPPGSGCSSQPQ